MGELGHWQPILTSRELGKAPVGVVICGRELVVFRAGRTIGVLEDRCPHRGMRLSRGTVTANRLQCPYHGWTYAADGNGESPGTPKLRACATHFDTLELHGLIWIKEPGVDAPFPPVNATGYTPLCQLDYVVEAPLELVLDNFTEVEHTPTTHALFGYQLHKMHEVTTRTETTVDSVRVINCGPQKAVPAPVTTLFGIHEGDDFVDDWTTWFSPVYTIYDQWWADPVSGTRRPVALRVVVLFTPIDDQRTKLFVFAQSSAPLWGKRGLFLLLKPLLRRLVDQEVRLDKVMIEALADKSVALTGKKLSRFDKALGENRKRLAAIYRGETRPQPV